MKVLLHSGFLSAWARLSAQERKVVQMFLSQLGTTGITPGMRPHNMRGAGTPLLSLSPNMDLRAITIRRHEDITILYVGHHDDAYNWGERNGMRLDALIAAEFTTEMPSEITSMPETQREAPIYGEGLAKELASAGVPPALCALLRKSRSEDEMLDTLGLLAPEWQELIIECVAGADGPKRIPEVIGSNIWVSPGDTALRAALSLPESLWRVFLHPLQLKVVEAPIVQDLVIIGGPGTGKTVALVHRAARLAATCKPHECVVLVGHSPTAVISMKEMIVQLVGVEPAALHIVDMIAIGRRGRPQDTDLFGGQLQHGRLRHLKQEVIALLVDEAADLHRTTKGYVFGRRPDVTTHITAAVDFNQEVFADNTTGIVPDLIRRSNVIHLTYSYRVPREAGMVAAAVSMQYAPLEEDETVSKWRAAARKLTFGFSAEFVKVFAYDALPQGILRAEQEIRMHMSRPSNMPVIFCGARNHRHEFSDQLTCLGYDKESDLGVLTPRAVKGLEFDYCLVLAPEFLLEGGQRQDFALQAIYVALSRVRRGLVIVARRDIAERLRLPGADVQEA